MTGLLCCPVCGQPLDLGEKTARCARGHCFDRAARGGYINLLKPGRRGSATPGDSAAMCQARTRFLEGGWYLPLREAVARQTAACAPGRILDAGCGEGWYTAAIGGAAPDALLAGIDLSKYALRHAGRACPKAQFAIASLFDLPVASGSVDLITHLFAPLCGEEFVRVLAPGGFLLTVTPGARHLWGLKEALYERPYENPTEIRTIDGLEFVSEVRIEEEITLTGSQTIEDLYQMTPYAWKTGREAAARLLERDTLTTPIAFQLHLYRKSE